ncbi:MAG TPA: type II toxin-antitoxin system Phd/YefM family antitoxin [Burkholderiaceae bacterium]|jgi:prevent-host-death family protein|nr:type II toxin-antitoxin system Phd/YefM family antitoxin [Burkholderiaceae bacterium]
MGSLKRTTTYTSREFNQDAGGAKRAAEEGPVYITDRGRPAHVLLSIDEYRRLTEPAASIVDLLAMPHDDGADFEAVPIRITLKPTDFS